jgi:hypothetical protein
VAWEILSVLVASGGTRAQVTRGVGHTRSSELRIDPIALTREHVMRIQEEQQTTAP